MQEHLFVCGHGQGDPGAGGNGINERDWTRHPFIKSVEKYGKMLKKNKIVVYDTKLDMYQQTQKGWGAYSVSKNTASVTEVHLDSASPSATGGHVIINSKYSPDKNDLAIANAVKKYVGLWGFSKPSGTYGRNNLLNLNVFAQRGINYRLVELGFISSKRDTDILKKDYDKIAKELVEAVTGEKISVPVGNNRPRHSVVTYWYGSKASGALKGVEKFCKDNNWNYRLESAKDGRVKLICGTFNQKSSYKNKLTKYLEDKNLNYEVVVL